MISAARDRHTHMEQTDQAAVAAATAGDETAFSALVERHRRELQVHCYRMLGSLDDAEDQLQETFLRAWRRRETYAGRSTFRAWLYRIATNACLDELARRPRRPSGGEVPWLQPYPDELLEAIPAEADDPGAAAVEKETIELAFMVAIQHLQPKARAALILRDVLDWSAKDAAALLDTSVASINSALQRARADMRAHLPEQRLEWQPGTDPTAAERDLLARYMDATERGDLDALAATMRADLQFSMPPQPGLFRGREEIIGYWVSGGFGTEALRMRCAVGRANRQPAVGCYVISAETGRYEPMGVDVRADRRGPDRGDHHLRRAHVRPARAPGRALMDPFAGPVPAGFARRRITLAPRAALAFDAAAWTDAIVLVEHGTLELVGRAGVRRRFGAGDVLALAPLDLSALRNPGAEPVELVAVTRRDEFSRALPS